MAWTSRSPPTESRRSGSKLSPRAPNRASRSTMEARSASSSHAGPTATRATRSDGTNEPRRTRSTTSVRRRATSAPEAPARGSRSSDASSLRRDAVDSGVRDSDGVGAHLPRADAVGLLRGKDEDLAVADLAGPGGLHDGVDHGLDLVVL